MTLIEYLLAGFATLLTVTSMVMAIIFVYFYGRTQTPLALYLALWNLGFAFSAVTQSITRWEHGFPCIPPTSIRIRLAGVVICGLLVTFSSYKTLRLLRPSKAVQPKVDG
jgi:hypothetical protein